MDDGTQPASESGAAPARALLPQPLPPSRFADPAKARRPVPLALAVVDEAGRTLDTVFVRKFSVAQIAVIIGNWSEARKVDPDAPLSFPSYVDANGAEIPSATMALLDDDDMQAAREAAEAFLPRRFRPDPEPETTPASSGLSTGDTTGPSSEV